MAVSTEGTDLEASLLSFEKLDRASPDLWPEQLPGVAEFAASFKSPITSSPPKWMAELENDDIDMLKELGSLTTANLMEKVRGLQNLAYQLGLDEYYPHGNMALYSDDRYFKNGLLSVYHKWWLHKTLSMLCHKKQVTEADLGKPEKNAWLTYFPQNNQEK